MKQQETRKDAKGPGKALEVTVAGSRLRRLFSFRTIRMAALFLAVLAAIPVTLTLVYAIEGVRPVSTLMLGRWITLKDVDRQWVEIEDVAPVALHSILMSEDGQFCFHRGVDLGELKAVIDDALQGEPSRGASTIPMQVAKNLYLWGGRSYVRKAIELPLAVWADIVWKKYRMMEIYINIAEWDEGVFGIEAASRHYFGIPASKLDRRQAALLAVTLPAPKSRNPAKPTRQMLRLASIIEKRARNAGGYVNCLEKTRQ